MLGKTWVFGSLFAAVTLIATAAAPAQAEERWNLGRAQWQPPTHGSWFGGEREYRGWTPNRDWDGRSEWGHERYAWSRRDHDDRRWDRERWERERRHEWWEWHRR